MRSLIALCILCLSAGGCGSDAPLRADTIQLGRTLNPDGTVGQHTTTFKTKDTIYASVLTANTGAGTVGVRWTYAGRLVGEPSRQVRYKGPAATEFHLANSSGFPLGDYKVEAFIDGKPVGERTFRVEE
jgi:hypothetical protein